MARISAGEMEKLQDLARLEYEVAEGRLGREVALEAAKKLGLSDQMLDSLARGPGQGGYAVLQGGSVAHGGRRPGAFMLRLQEPNRTEPAADTPTTRKMLDLPFSSVLAKRPLTKTQAEALFAQFGDRTGVPVRLDWDNPATGVWVDVENDRHIEIPGGLVRAPGVYEDTLALVIGHELSHLEGRHKDEARADYEATRIHLPRLLGPMDPEQFFSRALVAAYSLMLHLGSGHTSAEPLELRSADEPRLEMNPSGYPTLQSRWDLMKAGIISAPMLSDH